MNVVRMSLAVVLLGAIGCATLQPVQQPAQFIPAHNPSVVRITYTDYSRISLTHPRISGDTLFGMRLGSAEPVTVPLREVQLIQVVRPNGKKTTLLIAGLTAVTAVGVIAALAGNGPSGPMCTMSEDMMGQIC